jgi:hypothetical protein
MAENVEGHRGRRGRWLVLAVLLAIGVWIVRSQRAARADIDTSWPPPADTGAASTPAPPPAVEPAPRRPSPRPRPAPTP